MGRRRKPAQLSNRLLGLSLLICLVVASCVKYKAEALEAPAFKEMLDNNTDVQIVDVRTYDEFYTGHIVGAYNIDIMEEGFKQAMDTLDRSKPIAVYCLVGQRSYQAYRLLVEMKFREVYHLQAGTVAWQREKYELEKGPGRYAK